jgi:GNAT superfamily N-acetyltransferase
MAIQVSDPRTDVEGLTDLAPLWEQLHRRQGDVALPGRGTAVYWPRVLHTSRPPTTAGRLIGYAMVALEPGPDDTFDATGCIADVVTLVVARGHRSLGVGRALLAAAERIARDRGFDMVKIAVMRGNLACRWLSMRR